MCSNLHACWYHCTCIMPLYCTSCCFKQACFCLTVGRFEKKQWVLSSNKNVQEYHIFYIHRGQFVISSIKTGARLEKKWSMQAVGGSTKQKTVMIIKGIVKSSRLPAKIAAYLVSISRLLCLAFLYGWGFLIISLDWPLTLTTQLSTLKLSDTPESCSCWLCHFLESC